MKKDECAVLAQYCRSHLDFSAIEVGSEYGYSSVPLCVIDAVFSLGVRYTSTRNTVSRVCEFFDIPQVAENKKDNLSVSEFIKKYNEYGIEDMTERVYKNRQRTSTRSGILKAEAVLRFSEVLAQFGVEYLQDVSKILGDEEFESEIKTIPGQRSGISLRYFYMLAGSEDFIKPDRMINRFVYQATGKSFGIDETTALLIGACKILAEEFPGLTPRTFDNIIWQYQRVQ